MAMLTSDEYFAAKFLVAELGKRTHLT